jgi:hypothetical protein
MNRSVRGRFWLEAALASVTACLMLLTLIVPDWLEEIFGLDPDGGTGTVEIGIVVALVIATALLTVAAHRERRRTLEPA